MKAAVEESGSTVTKARLFDEGVHQDRKISDLRMVGILTDFTEQVKKIMEGDREAANRMEEISQRLTGSLGTRDIHLSDLSIPESFPDGTEPKEGRD